MGVNAESGRVQLEIKGLVEPKTEEAGRICREDLNELITAFVQDKQTVERGMFDKENLIPEELTQVRMGKIVKEAYPHLDDEDREAVRQHAIAALNLVRQAKAELTGRDADVAHASECRDHDHLGAVGELEKRRDDVNGRLETPKRLPCVRQRN